MMNLNMTTAMNMENVCACRHSMPVIPCRIMPKNSLRSGGSMRFY